MRRSKVVGGLLALSVCFAPSIASAQPSPAGSAEPAAPKPAAPKPDAPAPDAPKPDAPKPDAPKPDAPKAPDAPTPPDAPKPDAPVFDDKGRQLGKPKAPPKRQKITLPKPLNRVSPRYPDAARKAGLEGTVTLKIDIDKTGTVKRATVFEGAGHGFDEAAEEAAYRLKFSPARKADGTPFRAVIKYRFSFKLEDKKIEQPKVVTGVLRGRILVQRVGEPLAGATVRLAPSAAATLNAGGTKAAPLEVLTDGAGKFEFPTLPPGRYAVTIEAAGFEALTVNEEVLVGKELIATYRLTPKTKAGAIEVFVEGKRPPREVTRRTIERREIERIPGTNGDALRSLTSLPGVARPPGILGALLVRGSAPQDTLTFVDGVFVPIIYHFGGLSSVVPTELLSKIDFYPGNFSARYGRAMGGIVDAGIRSPRSDGFHGMAQLDLIDARVMAEGPIANGWTFAVAGRRSYLDAWLGPALEEAGAGVTQAPVYYDYQALVERKWKRSGPDTTAGRFRVSFYGSDDALEILLKEPPAGQPALGGQSWAAHKLSTRPGRLRARAHAAGQARPPVRTGSRRVRVRSGVAVLRSRGLFDHRPRRVQPQAGP